ncbi:MAG: citrate/2-methylcitrate synthase [Candidatus Thiodiazotropha sp.]
MPKKVPWNSEITTVSKNRLVTHGYDQQDIIRDFSYEEMIYLLMFGQKPNSTQKKILRAVIVAYCSHGITGQSTLSVRMGVDCGSSFMNSAIAGFSVGSGEYHQGALESSMRLIKEANASKNVIEFVDSWIEQGKVLAGFGHRFHPQDPRATELIQMCNERRFGGEYIETAKKIEAYTKKRNGRSMNLGAAAASILLDMGFPAEIAFLIIMVGRGPMFAAAYMERLKEGNRPFQRIEVLDIKPGRE